MSHEVIVYLGPARSGKTQELLCQFRETLRSAPVGVVDNALWIAPNRRAAAAARDRLVGDGLDACFSPGVVTFDDLAAMILSSAASRLRPATPGMERELIRRTIRAAVESNSLKTYGDAARRDSFVDLLLEHISELRRRGVTPAQFVRRRPASGSPEAHKELAALYAAYQQVLDANQLIDSVGIPWAACDALAKNASPRFRQLALLVVDGFTDFTAPQHKTLSLLAGRTRQLLISLPSDPQTRLEPNTRADLFVKTATTLAELRRHHPHIVERHFAARQTNWPAHDHLTSNIFRYPIPPAAADVLNSPQRIEIIEAAGVHDEIVQIARRIKLLLTSHNTIRAKDVVVVFRSLADAAPRIREVFHQFGIPFAVETRQRLITSSLVKTLLSVLRLDGDDWPFRRAVSVLTNNTLSAITHQSRQAADWLIRDLQIAGGRRPLLDRVEQLAADPTPPTELGDHARRRRAAAKNALPAFRVLCTALDTLPQAATPSEWCDALQRFSTTLGLPPFANAPSALRTGHFSDQSIHDPLIDCDSTDALAWQCIVEHFASLERLDAWLGQPPQKLSRPDLISALLDTATHQSLPRQHDEIGRVRILSAPTASTISARHLFLAGMSEQAFPAPERAGRLGTEAEYRFYSRGANSKACGNANDASVPPAPQVPTRTHEEMLLFYQLLSRAEDSLTISYPALDDKAQQLPPSPYVIEIRRVLGAGTNQSAVSTSKPQLSPIPQSDPPLSVADCRIQAVATAIGKDGHLGLLAGFLSHDAQRTPGGAIEAGLRIVHARARGENFSPAEGLLITPLAAARFAQRFGPQHLWSPSQWETYAACPYKFFLENVLGVEPLGDLVLETDHTRRGSRLHQVLADFHRKWPAVRGDRALPAEEEAALFINELKKSLDHETAAAPRAGIDAALLELDRRQILKWAESHFLHHARYANQWSKLPGQFAPTHFELRFGPPRAGDIDSDDPASCNEPFQLEVNGEFIRVAGKIDRIDVATIDGQLLFNVIDYKSGRKPSLKLEHIASGEHLQLPIYVAAARALVFGDDGQPLAAGYWTMHSGFDSKGILASNRGDEGGERWAELNDTVKARVGEFISAIRHGEFPVASRDDKCTSRCDFSTICRITQIRSLGKTWEVKSQESRVEGQKNS